MSSIIGSCVKSNDFIAYKYEKMIQTNGVSISVFESGATNRQVLGVHDQIQTKKKKATTVTLCEPLHWKAPTTQWKGQELNGNGLTPGIAQVIEKMKAEQEEQFSMDHINLAELERRGCVSRGKLRRLKWNGFRDLPRSTKGGKHTVTKLSGYTGLLDSLLRQGGKNSSVVSERLKQAGFGGGTTIVKEYIAPHKHLVLARR